MLTKLQPITASKYSLHDISMDLNVAKKCLTEREYKIIQLRFYEGRTLKETAENIGVNSSQYALCLQKKALAKMKKILN